MFRLPWLSGQRSHKGSSSQPPPAKPKRLLPPSTAPLTEGRRRLVLLAGVRTASPSPTPESGVSMKMSHTKPKTGQLQLILRNQCHTERGPVSLGSPPSLHCMHQRCEVPLRSCESLGHSQAEIVVCVGQFVTGPQPDTVFLLHPGSSLRRLVCGRSCPPKGQLGLPFLPMASRLACVSPLPLPVSPLLGNSQEQPA